MVGTRDIVDGRDLVLLADARKELQISQCISTQSGFTGDPFPWKRTGLAKRGGWVESERHRFRAKQGGESKGSWRLGWPEGWWPESQESKSFVLRTYTVVRMGVKKLHVD